MWHSRSAAWTSSSSMEDTISVTSVMLYCSNRDIFSEDKYASRCKRDYQDGGANFCQRCLLRGRECDLRPNRVVQFDFSDLSKRWTHAASPIPLRPPEIPEHFKCRAAECKKRPPFWGRRMRLRHPGIHAGLKLR